MHLQLVFFCTFVPFLFYFEQAYTKIRTRPRFCFDSGYLFFEGLSAMFQDQQGAFYRFCSYFRIIPGANFLWRTKLLFKISLQDS